MTGSIADRVHAGVPTGMPETATFLRLAEIIETREVPTAAIGGFARLRLSLNPDFVERHAPTPERLFMLLMHEIHHVTLGHTTKGLGTPRDNFVFDAVINALISRRFPERAHTGLLTDFYACRFPEFLLRPPPQWRPGQRRRDHLRAWIGQALVNVPLRVGARARSVYAALHSGRGATYDEVEAVLPPKLELSGIRLLGSHDGRGPGPGCLPVEGAAVRDFVGAALGESPSAPELGWSRGDGGDLGESRIRPRREPNNRTRLRRLIERVARFGDGRLLSQPRSEAHDIVAPLPRPDRRSIVLRALDADPVLRISPFPVPSRVPAGSRVHLYLDVSGSMGNMVEPLYRAVLDCSGLIHRRVHLFSTRVVDVSLSDMRKGKVKTTGGTDIACVAEHMGRRRVRRACIITDGFVGVPAGERREILEAAVLGVAVPGDGSLHHLESVADHRAVLRT